MSTVVVSSSFTMCPRMVSGWQSAQVHNPFTEALPAMSNPTRIRSLESTRIRSAIPSQVHVRICGWSCTYTHIQTGMCIFSPFPQYNNTSAWQGLTVRRLQTSFQFHRPWATNSPVARPFADKSSDSQVWHVSRSWGQESARRPWAGLVLSGWARAPPYPPPPESASVGRVCEWRKMSAECRPVWRMENASECSRMLPAQCSSRPRRMYKIKCWCPSFLIPHPPACSSVTWRSILPQCGASFVLQLRLRVGVADSCLGPQDQALRLRRRRRRFVGDYIGRGLTQEPFLMAGRRTDGDGGGSKWTKRSVKCW